MGYWRSALFLARRFIGFSVAILLTFKSPSAWTPLLLPTYVHVIPICSSRLVAITFGGACMHSWLVLLKLGSEMASSVRVSLCIEARVIWC